MGRGSGRTACAMVTYLLKNASQDGSSSTTTEPLRAVTKSTAGFIDAWAAVLFSSGLTWTRVGPCACLVSSREVVYKTLGTYDDVPAPAGLRPAVRLVDHERVPLCEVVRCARGELEHRAFPRVFEVSSLTKMLEMHALSLTLE